VSSPETLAKWRKDKSIPLVEVVGLFKVFVQRTSGAQSLGDTASKAELDNEFGTSNVDEVIKKILQEGEDQGEYIPAQRWSSTNDVNTGLVSHR
jgi:ribosome maturation protein Sdo1